MCPEIWAVLLWISDSASGFILLSCFRGLWQEGVRNTGSQRLGVSGGKRSSVRAMGMQRSEQIRAQGFTVACVRKHGPLVPSCDSVRWENTSAAGIISLVCHWHPTWADCSLVHVSLGEVTLHSFQLAEAFSKHWRMVLPLIAE